MEFRILGPLEVLENGHHVPLRGSKQRALLASLLLHANEVVSRDRLIDELWGASPPDTARTALQVYASQLRKALGRDLILSQTWRGGGWRGVPARRAGPRAAPPRCPSSLELKRGQRFCFSLSITRLVHARRRPFGPSQPSLVPKTCPQLPNAAGAPRKR